jgi:hypothetical protein
MTFVEGGGMGTTGQDLIDFWNWAAEKGRMNSNTAGGMRVACVRVLGALGDPAAVDVKTLNVDDALRRFERLKASKFKPPVLNVYKRRFQHAVAYFLEFLDDPAGWKPRSLDRPLAERSNGTGATNQTEPSRPVRVAPGSNMVDYPFPVREGQIAHLILPRDLRAAEAKRLAAFISTLVVESESSG